MHPNMLSLYQLYLTTSPHKSNTHKVKLYLATTSPHKSNTHKVKLYLATTSPHKIIEQKYKINLNYRNLSLLSSCL